MIRRLLVLIAIVALVAALFLPSGVLGITLFSEYGRLTITLQQGLMVFAIAVLLSIIGLSLSGIGRCH